ncbi:Hypothetical predicted protein [Mytilus galloprovincialis]|uniref:C2H2-type domain-containing protein n=1 Tax=Mytilus galloprovincialis TaxID=29158 RepID=A0A8B6D838_MYTGA|nr:Hypothetical predicted protein [Mytilus galloprovincialis]
MMEDEDNSQSVCSICGNRLSRKETLAKHLQVFHKIQPECSPVKYKRYLNDPTIPVPRTTQYIKRKTDEDKHETVQEFPQPGSGSITLSLYTEGEMSNSFTEWHCDGELEEKIDSVQYSELIPDDSLMDENNISTFELHGDTCMLNQETNKTADKEMLSLEMEDDSSSVSSDADSFQYSELDDFKESDNSTESEFEDSNTIDLEEEISKFSEFDEKCMAILSFVLKHHLSWQASLNFTELIGIFLKENEISLDKIKQMVGACQPDIIDFCDKCFILFPENENIVHCLRDGYGVPLYKSSGISIWPVYLVINERPPMMRFSRKNLILWGVWQAKGKPMFQTFFQPFVKQMIDLKNNGIVVKLQNVETTIKAALIAGTLDLQAKAIVADMTQHNGQYGCITCLEPGEVVKQGRGHCRVFPFRENGAPARSSTDILQNGIKATENGKKGKPVLGIKGVSCLHGMDWFDVVYGLVPDYMHGTLLGVTKKLLHLFFSPSNSGKLYFIGKYTKEVDKNLKKMQPTDNISRLPRKLEKNLHHLKASELEVWLL